MNLKDEIELNRDFQSVQEEALLSIVYTDKVLLDLSQDFFKPYGLTTTQFNCLMIIRDYQEDGIKQFELSRRLLINRASTGTLIDGLEKRDLVERIKGKDRRSYFLSLTNLGDELLASFLPEYYKRLSNVFNGIKPAEMKALISTLAKVRENLS